MISIQEIGTEIFNKTPRKFYVMLGAEYGIKYRYIQMLKEQFEDYNDSYDMNSLMKMLNTRHIVPLRPTLYVVRYDEQFISSIDATTSNKIDNLKFPGCIVCVYEQPKHTAKCEKFLDKHSVTIGEVSLQFMIKYLHQDFPNLSDTVINSVAQHCHNYYHGVLMCKGISKLSNPSALASEDVPKLFGIEEQSTETMIKHGVASRNFRYLLKVLDDYPDDLDGFIYTMLSTLLELEKILSDRRAQSDLKQYLKSWSLEDIYNMFMITYNELKKSRTIATNKYSSIVYLISLLQFQKIPTLEVME